MIGIWISEELTVVEFKPWFAHPRYGFSFRLPKIFYSDNFGEYGVSFSSDFTIWWHWKHTTYLYHPSEFFKRRK